MTTAELLDQIIADLTAAREDATKVDNGKPGSPGTRVRKAAQEAKRNLDGLRKAVIDIRKS